jgi:drug/metabolite transporter (DMT)-like permease
MDEDITEDKNNPVVKTRSDRYAYAILTLGTVFYATNHVIGRGIHTEIPPVGLSFWRWFVGAIILFPFVRQNLFLSSDTIKSNLGLLSFLGFTMIGGSALILIALNYSDAINTSLINTIQPVMTVLLSSLILKDHLTRGQLIGVLAGFTGVVLMVSRADWLVITSLQFNYGDLLTLLAVLAFAFYAINIRKIPKDLDARVSLFVIIMTGCIMLLPFYIAESVLFRSVPFNITSVVVILTLALFMSLLGILVWNEGNRIIGPNRAGMFINLIPVFTAALAIVFLNEELYLYHLSGAVLISTGIFLVLRN